LDERAGSPLTSRIDQTAVFDAPLFRMRGIGMSSGPLLAALWVPH
jgi:hypothetical protein